MGGLQSVAVGPLRYHDRPAAIHVRSAADVQRRDANRDGSVPADLRRVAEPAAAACRP
jgi:hypothetical protein